MSGWISLVIRITSW